MIALEDLSFGYRREEPILEQVSWRFAPGAMSAVTGPSGRGKSTLLYLIGLLLTPWSGRVMWDGAPVGGLDDAQRSAARASDIGFVFQDAALDPYRSVLDNVTEGSIYAGLGRRPARRRAAVLLDRFGVQLAADSKPGEVSGGQAQRVALCRALLNEPRLILADEPTGNLDQVATDVVLDALVAEAEAGATVIVASHDSAVVDRCNEVLAL